MNLQELATVVQESLPLRIAVIDNGYLGMVRQWQERFYGRCYSSVQLSGPDLMLLGKAYGIPTCRVDRAEQLGGALDLAGSADGPILLWLQVRVEENVYPVVTPGASLDEMIIITERVVG
jgi:acetolactate synthase-1/2/3 large subunit